jgi:hypothetical protein
VGAQTGVGAHMGAPLHRIIQWVKTMTTNSYIHGVKYQGWQPFSKRLWQRNYYERIIRDEEELNRIRKYITTNPANWEADQDNPSNLMIYIINSLIKARD